MVIGRWLRKIEDIRYAITSSGLVQFSVWSFTFVQITCRRTNRVPVTTVEQKPRRYRPTQPNPFVGSERGSFEVNGKMNVLSTHMPNGTERRGNANQNVTKGKTKKPKLFIKNEQTKYQHLTIFGCSPHFWVEGFTNFEKIPCAYFFREKRTVKQDGMRTFSCRLLSQGYGSCCIGSWCGCYRMCYVFRPNFINVTIFSTWQLFSTWHFFQCDFFFQRRPFSCNAYKKRIIATKNSITDGPIFSTHKER